MIGPNVADRKDDQTPGPTGPSGDAGRPRDACSECGAALAPDQRYCVDCGHRRAALPGAVAGTVGALTTRGKALAAAAGAMVPKPKGEDEGWSWMPSPQAIAIAVIGMLALGVGLGSAMSEIADSAPLQTILLEYPHHAEEGPAPEEPEEEAVEEEAPVVAAAPEEVAVPEEIATEPLPEEPIEVPEEPLGSEEPKPAPFNPFEEPEEAELGEGTLPEIKHAWLIVLGENSYEKTYGAAAEAPYLTRVLPGKGELIPNYYGVTSGVLANEIALLSGQGPTAETALNYPNYTAIAPGTASETAEQVEGAGCVYPKEVESLPTQLEEKGLKWRTYVEDMENGGAIGQPWRCRKPTLGAADTTIPSPGDQYANWRNPVVYFGQVAEGDECEKHDVGFEILTKDLRAKKSAGAVADLPRRLSLGRRSRMRTGRPERRQGRDQR